jgi:hypothetical protein
LFNQRAQGKGVEVGLLRLVLPFIEDLDGREMGRYLQESADHRYVKAFLWQLLKTHTHSSALAEGLGINVAGVALVLDLLEEIEALQNRRIMRHQRIGEVTITLRHNSTDLLRLTEISCEELD